MGTGASNLIIIFLKILPTDPNDRLIQLILVQTFYRQIRLQEEKYSTTSDNIAIRVKNLGKKYTLGGPQEQYQTLRDTMDNSRKSAIQIILSCSFG